VRLFVALIPPDRALDEIEAAFAPCRDGRPELRWTHRESWHITLAFYGEVDERTAARLEPRLERAAGRHPRRDLAFAGAGAFPKARSARTLWTGVHTDLGRLAGSCEAAGRREGVDTSGHLRFHAHLTVARSRVPLDLRSDVTALEAYEGTPWPADEIHLVRSHLGTEAPRYEILRSWPLSRPTESR
jgi:RNA 2',3'-cyclic 3'-phosphodiesterase